MNADLIHALAMALADDQPSPQEDAILMELREICDRSQHPNPFHVGDLVTPRTGYGMNGAGDPHIVIEVFDPPVRWRPDNAGYQTAMGRYDMRTVNWDSGDYVAHIGESWAWEPWEPKP